MAEQTGGKPEYTPGSKTWTEDTLRSALDIFLMRPDISLRNISLVESVYPYLSIDNTSVTLYVDGQRKQNAFKKQNLTNSNTTLSLELNDSVKAGSIAEIHIDSKLNMSLPVDVTSESILYDKIQSYRANKNTPRSQLTYTWYNNRIFKVDLPENVLNISP